MARQPTHAPNTISRSRPPFRPFSQILSGAETTFLRPTGLDHSTVRALGAATVTTTVVDPLTIVRAKGVATRPRPLRRSQIVIPETETIGPAGLNRGSTRALGSPTVLVGVGSSTIVRAAVPLPKAGRLRQTSTIVGGLTITTTLAPAGLVRTRSIGDPAVAFGKPVVIRAKVPLPRVRTGFGKSRIVPRPPPGVVYFVSPTGSDAANGLTTGTAWQTLAKVNGFAFSPGDTILFQGGQTFTGGIVPTVGGTTAAPITFGSYGTGKATISAAAVDGILLWNLSGFAIQDLIITGPGAATATKQGINLYNDTGARMTQAVTIRRCDVSGFKSGIIAGGDTKGWVDLLIEDCTSNANQVGGITTYGPVFAGSAPYANANVTVRRCSANNNLGKAGTGTVTGTGIILGNVDTGLIELSSASGNGQNCDFAAGPSGIGAYNCIATVISRCISRTTNTALADGNGFDLDYNALNCRIEYCLAYGNKGPGFLYAAPGNAEPTPAGSSGNVFRFNISHGNGSNGSLLGEFHLFGDQCGSCDFYGNTAVAKTIGAANPSCIAVGTIGGATPTSNTFRNNIFVQLGTGPVMQSDLAYTTSQTLFQGNAYYKASGLQIKWGATTYTTLATWRAAVTAQEVVGITNTGYVVDPLFVNSSTAPTVTDPNVARDVPGLHLTSSSTLKNTAIDLQSVFSINPGTADYLIQPLFVPYSLGAIVLAQVTPVSLTRTRALGAPTVRGPVAPAALLHARAQGTPVLDSTGLLQVTSLNRTATYPEPGRFPDPGQYPGTTRGLGAVSLVPAATIPALTRTRALGTPQVIKSASPASLTHTRALGATAVAGTFPQRRIGSPVITVAWVPRPTGLAHTRTLGSPVAHGKATLTPVSLTKARFQGNPTLSARIIMTGLVHSRAQGIPLVNPPRPASLTHTRAQGSITVTILWMARPEGQVHTRAVGSTTIRGRLTLGPASLARTRAQGVPTLSGRALPPSLSHTRVLGVAAVNVRTLVPVALVRA